MGFPLLLAPIVFAPGAEAPRWDRWPPREVLIEGLAASVESTLASQNAETGRFGSEPWICGDQNVIFPLAVAWAIQDEKNPWYHSDRLLQAIGKGGEALVDDQDEKGMWIFRKKDNSTWGQIHMPWTYSRWIRAYQLIGDALPAETKAKWEQGLLLGFNGIRRYADGGVHNIPTHHAMALYIAGECFGNEEWKSAAKAFMARVVESQDPAGFWSEHYGPVVGYNEVYVDALGVYYHESQDPVVLEALKRSAHFHSSILWPDGSSASAIDERQIYHAGRDIGNVGFSQTPEGRGFLLSQVSAYVADGRLPNADYAASMLLYSGEGEGILPAAAGDTGRAVVGDDDAVIQRRKPWQWCLSSYACKPIQNRWIQDRQNLVDVFHDGLGLVVGGGNTKLQPYWSTFTIGNPSLLKHEPGDESPDFLPEIPLLWTPDEGRLDLASETPTLNLKYAETACSVAAAAQTDGRLVLTHRAPAGQQVESHMPLLKRGPKLRLADGRRVLLTDEEFVLSREEIGDRFTYAGLCVTVPAGASLRWPALQHDPYTKDGHSSLNAAKLVLCLPFPEGVSEQAVTLSLDAPPPFEGQAFEARDLPFRSDTGTRTKRLDDLGSEFLGGTKPGDSITFTLPEVKPGRYELLGEFVLADSYATVRVLLDGKPVGQPFDAYCPGVDAEGECVSFGEVVLGAGTHEVMIEVVGKNEKATQHFISVKRWLLCPR
ncbi:MAG: hypothetical protein FJX75_27230 [Armatimonadetes bacterium]|nr:hypothetical protein [Armatimonadota bacterium]